MKKMTQDEIAGQLGLSRATIVRILRNDPCVKAETRNKVVHFLNKVGFCNQTHSLHEKLILDCINTEFSDNKIIEYLREKLLFRNICFIQTDRENDPRTFLREVEQSGTLIFFGMHDEQCMKQVQEANPDIYTINVFSNGTRLTNISIEPDNTSSGRLAAEYLYNHGHRDILLVSTRSNDAFLTRSKSFMAEFMFHFPDCRVEPYFVQAPDPDWEEKLLRHIRMRNTLPTAINLTGCTFLDGIVRIVENLGLKIPEDISVLSHDNPDDFDAKNPFPCDAVTFNLVDITQLLEYFITNRPLLPGGCHLAVSPDIWIEKRGSVRKIAKEKLKISDSKIRSM